MKKVMALLCVLFLFGQSVFFVAADTPTVVAADVTGMPGETVAVTIRFEGNPGLISAKVKVGYDATALEFVEVEEGDFPSQWYSFGNPAKNPFVVTFCNGTAGGNYAAQLFATLRFKIREDAPAGTYPLTLTCDFEGDFFNCDWDAIYFNIDEGSVTVVRTGNTTSAKPTATTDSTSATPDAPTTAATGDGTARPTASDAVTQPSVGTTAPTATTAPDATDKQDAPTTPWIAVAIPLAAIIAIAAGSILFVFLRKKKKK